MFEKFYQKHVLLTGDGLPVAAHRNVAPVEFENRIKAEGVVTNFGPIKSISLTFEDDWVARTISEDAEMNNCVKKKLVLILLIYFWYIW